MPDQPTTFRTPMHAAHLAAGAEMGDVAGWEMPLRYRTPAEECRDLHQRAGVIDLGHHGRIRVRGDGAVDLLERLCTADVARQEDDTAQVSLVLNEDGGIIADVLVVRLETFWVLVCSPPCRQRLMEHAAALAEPFNAKVDDQTLKTGMVGVVGPAAPEILDAVLPEKVSALPDGTARSGSMLIARYIALRSDRLGLWGLHVMLPNMLMGQGWRFITNKAGANAITPVGLEAMDVLRIEAAVPAYGAELDETVDPVLADLMDAVDMAHDFLGRSAVQRLLDSPPSRKLVSLELTALPPAGAALLTADGQTVGTITSAAASDALGKVIALGYVSADLAETSAELFVALGAEPAPARITRRRPGEPT